MPARSPAFYLLACLWLLCGCRRDPHPNVLFVTIDTLRADRLGSYGYGPARTPHLDRLAAEGVRATDAAAAAPITLPSHSTLFTGLLPPTHGVRDNGTHSLPDEAVTLAERLLEAGYRTQAVVSALVLNRRYNLNQGFEGYDDDLWAENEPKLFMIRDRPAPRTAARAVEWLESWRREDSQKPFFLWVHFFDPHQPLEATTSVRLTAATPYDAEITMADGGVGTLLTWLSGHRELDNTLVVVTADHGESLGEHGEATHAIFIYEATMKVPLLLRYPRLLPAGTTYNGPVHSADLVPTLLAALGLPGGEETQGRNLLPAFSGRGTVPPTPRYLESMLSEVGFGMAPLQGVKHDGHKWIRAPRPELYDLSADPHELRNLYPNETTRAAKLNRELDQLLGESAKRALQPRSSPMDRETLEALQALGYLAASADRKSMGGMDPKDGIVLYQQLEDARHLAQKEKWAEAEALLTQLLAELPGNVSARNVLALTRQRQGDLQGAKDEYLRSLADDPGQARVYQQLGVLSFIEGNLEEARRHSTKALEITPGFVEATGNLGLIAALEGKAEEAERLYQDALAQDPSYHRGYRRLADLYFERQDFAKALAFYEKTLVIQPSDFDAQLQAGNAARRVGDAAQAARFFDTAAKLRADSWIPLYNRACLAAVSGETEEALALLEKSVDLGLEQVRLLAEDSDLESLRSDPRFQRLVARMAG